MILRALLFICACLLLAGCAEKTGIVGDWEGKDNGGRPTVLSLTQDKITMDVKNPDGNIILEGTYKLTGEKMDFEMTSGRIENVPAEKMILKTQFDEQLKKSLPQKSSATIKLEGNDTLTLKPDNGPETTFKRK
jgi:hypothetical protein